MEILSKRYGWLPSQIRNERAADIEQYMEIIAMENKIEKARTMKNK